MTYIIIAAKIHIDVREIRSNLYLHWIIIIVIDLHTFSISINSHQKVQNS